MKEDIKALVALHKHRAIEKILMTYDASEGCLTESARRLGVKRDTLSRYIAQLGIGGRIAIMRRKHAAAIAERQRASNIRAGKLGGRPRKEAR